MYIQMRKDLAARCTGKVELTSAAEHMDNFSSATLRLYRRLGRREGMGYSHPTRRNRQNRPAQTTRIVPMMVK
jgi:hypothetical protein